MLVRLLALVAGFGQHAPHLLHNAPVSQRAPPPVGANYKKTLSLPVIGDQTVVLNILSAARARLVMSGALTLEDTVEYEVDAAGALSFTLSAPTVALLKRMRTSLSAAGYTSTDDKAWFTISPPLVPAIRIQLDRESNLASDVADADQLTYVAA